jgi:cyanophycinase
MQELIKVSAWKQGDWISVVTLTSRWDSAFISMNNEFLFLTQSKMKCIRIDSNTVKNPVTLDSMRKSKIIYLNGGDQNLLMKHIQGTAFKKLINEAYDNGATIAGTSAGAALMSELMITGEYLKRKDFKVVWKGNVEIKEGLGFLDSVIVDQHFIVRGRTNRLLSAVLDHPKYDGIGIDESTAIIVKGDSATVTGESQVLVYWSPSSIKEKGDNLVGTNKLTLSVFLPGDKFKIRR